MGAEDSATAIALIYTELYYSVLKTKHWMKKSWTDVRETGVEERNINAVNATLIAVADANVVQVWDEESPQTSTELLTTHTTQSISRVDRRKVVRSPRTTTPTHDSAARD